MDEKRNLCRALVRKPEVGSLLVRHGHKWEIFRINLQGRTYECGPDLLESGASGLLCGAKWLKIRRRFGTSSRFHNVSFRSARF
jgi:hypothetical protein